MKRDRESGQALVLVLLSLAVVLTLVLFVLARSVTDIAVSSRQEESVRAFSAAEAGIEKALVVGTSLTPTDIGNASYTATVSDFAEGETEFAYPILLSSGDSATVWFMAHDQNGDLTTTGAFTGNQIKVCWGNPGTSAASDTTPAVEVSIFYETTPGSLGGVKVARSAFDPYPGRTPPDSFSTSLDAGTCTIAGENYAFSKIVDLPVSTGLLFARIRMFYNDTPQKVGAGVAGGLLPSQGQKITSTGLSTTTEEAAGGSTRRIDVFQGWPESPFASNALIVPAGITK